MAGMKKTNAMRMLDAAGAQHDVITWECETALSGVEVAELLGEDCDQVFKTLVTQGKSGEHYVFMVPVAQELDLKKAARAAGEKSIEMIKSRELLPLTGYVHGGCSPIGMKKQFPTFIDETCVLFDCIMFSAGALGAQVKMPFDELCKVVDVEPVDLVVD